MPRQARTPREIAPGVFWINGGAANLYLCAAADELSLVDTGMPRKQQLVFDLIHRLGRQPRDLRHILITHADLDHAGSLAALQAATGARIYAGAETAVYLQKGASPPHLPRLAQLVLNRFLKYPPVPGNLVETIADGDELPIFGGLRVLATPGHTLDHLAFFAPGCGVLFAGDALNTRNGRLQSSPPRITADPDAASRSAARLLALSPSCIACGHGAPMCSQDVLDGLKSLSLQGR